MCVEGTSIIEEKAPPPHAVQIIPRHSAVSPRPRDCTGRTPCPFLTCSAAAVRDEPLHGSVRHLVLRLAAKHEGEECLEALHAESWKMWCAPPQRASVATFPSPHLYMGRCGWIRAALAAECIYGSVSLGPHLNYTFELFAPSRP